MPEAGEAVTGSAVEAKKQCPICQTENNIRNKICRKCRYRFESELSSNAQAVEISRVHDSPSQSTVTRLRSQGVTIDLTPVAAVRERFRVSRSLSELRLLYVEIAVARVEQRAYAQAVDALQQALDINDTSIQNSDILFYLAYVYELMNDMSRAFHTYLEALVEAPAFIDEVLRYAHSLLTVDIVLEQNKWVLNEWTEKIAGVCADSALNRMHVALLIAHVYLLLDRYAKARHYLLDAHQQAPDTASTMTPYLFGADVLPSSLAAARTDSAVSLSLAQLYQALGNTQLAMEEIDHTLALADAGSKDATLLANAYQCKAELLEQLDEKKRAAKYFFDAGMQYFEQNDARAAIEPLRQANRLDDQHIPTYWYLSDALRIYSYSNDDATFVEQQITESRDVWQRGYLLKHPDADDAWAFILRALVNMQFTRLHLPGTDRWTLTWEALAYSERSALYSRPATTYAYLGSFSRMLRLTQSALSLTRKAVEAEPGNSFIVGERISALDEVEDYNEAEDLANKLYDQEKSPDNLLTKAYITLRRERLKETLQLIEPILAPDAPGLAKATLLRAHTMRAYCLQRLGNLMQALESSRWIKDHCNQDDLVDRENWSTYAWAAFDIGDTANVALALKLAEQQEDWPGEDPGGRFFIVGLCLLAQGDSEQGETNIRKSIEHSTTIRQLDSGLDSLLNFEQCWESTAQQPQVTAVLDRAKKLIDERKAQLAQAASPEDELKTVLRATESTSDKSGDWAWIAAMAGLGRFYTESGHWQEAFETYHELVEKAGEELFPEALQQQEEAIDHLFDAFDEAIRMFQVDRIVQLRNYLQSLVFSPGDDTLPGYLANDRKRLARLFCQVGYVQLLADSEASKNYLAGSPQSRSELREAMTKSDTAPYYFVAGLMLFAQSGSPDDFAHACRPLFHDATYYWYLDAFLREMAEVEEIVEGMRNIILQATEALMSYLGEAFKLSALAPPNIVPDPPLPSASLFLELGLDLIPPDLDQEKVFREWNLIKTYIPNLRQHFKSESGIVLPGVKIQDNRWISKTAYKIRHYDTVLAEGETPSGMIYTLASLDTFNQLNVPKEQLVPTSHPLTGVPGYWVPVDHGETLEKHNEEVWTDPIIFITCAIEAAVQGNLGRLLEVQTAQWLLDSWEKDASLKDNIKQHLPDATTRFRCARLLRALVQEQVSLATPQAILDALQTCDLAHGSIGELLRHMRLHLKPHLPGNKPDVRRIELPAAWEDKLLACMQDQDGIIAFEVPPEETIALLQWLQGQIQPGTTGWKRALITHNAGLRPFLWPLLHTSFPLMGVLAQEEVLSISELHEVEQTYADT